MKRWLAILVEDRVIIVGPVSGTPSSIPKAYGTAVNDSLYLRANTIQEAIKIAKTLFGIAGSSF